VEPTPPYGHPSLITIILGPTAVGKTALSLSMAQSQGAHIISADAFQVYRGLDIGTAKLAPHDRIVPHHLIDIMDPTDQYSVSDFCKQTSDIIRDLSSQSIPIIICGGTAFYLNAFIYGFDFPEATNTQAISDALRVQLDTHGLPFLVDRLASIDPDLMPNLDISNSRRVIRALTIYDTTGHLPSQVRTQHPRTDIRLIGLEMDRAKLVERIHMRIDDMLKDGWIDEVKGLLDQGIPANCPGFQAIGYREITLYLQGKLDYDGMVELIKTKTRQFSKRQMTWYRRFLNVEWRYAD